MKPNYRLHPFFITYHTLALCLKLQYGFCDTVYRNCLLIKKVSSEIRKRHSEIRKRQYPMILCKVIRDTLQSITWYLPKYHVLLFSPSFPNTQMVTINVPNTQIKLKSRIKVCLIWNFCITLPPNNYSLCL